MTILLTCIDQWKREITLSADCWHNHVLRNHIIMDPYLNRVKKAVEDPSRVMLDRTSTYREAFYRDKLVPNSRMLVKVCVEFDPPDANGIVRGQIVTTYLTNRIKAGESKKWP